MPSTEHRESDDPRERQRRFMAMLLPVRDRLVRFARGMVRRPEDAEDLIGDTMLAAYERFEQVRDEKAFLSYLFTIAVRVHRQKKWRRRLFGPYDEEKASELPSRGTAPDVSADIQILRKALARLPEKQREAVVLFELSGLSLEEIREVQGGSLSGVKSRLTRGREKLAELLLEEDTAGGRAAMTRVAMRDEVEPVVSYSKPKNNG